MQQEPGNIEEAPAGAPKQTGAWAEEGEKCLDKGSQVVAQPEKPGAEPVQAAVSMGQSGPAEFVGAAAGKDCAQSSAGAGEACADEQGGFRTAPEMMGGQSPGVGSQKMGPIPGQEYYYGHPHPSQNVGVYGSPAYGPHMAGSVMGQTQGWPCHHGHVPHQAGMHQQPPQVPYFAGAGNNGYVHAGPSLHEGQGAAHYGPFAEVVGKALQGQATPQDLVSGLLNLNFRDDQFWKGVVVGSVAALIFNSDSLRQTLAGALGSVFGSAGKPTQADEKSTE